MWEYAVLVVGCVVALTLGAVLTVVMILEILPDDIRRMKAWLRQAPRAWIQ